MFEFGSFSLCRATLFRRRAKGLGLWVWTLGSSTGVEIMSFAVYTMKVLLDSSGLAPWKVWVLENKRWLWGVLQQCIPQFVLGLVDFFDRHISFSFFQIAKANVVFFHLQFFRHMGVSEIGTLI